MGPRGGHLGSRMGVSQGREVENRRHIWGHGEPGAKTHMGPAESGGKGQPVFCSIQA